MAAGGRAVDPILQFEARPRPVGVSTVPSCGASESEYELRTQDRWRETGSNRCPCPRREVHRRNPSVALSRRSGMWGLLLEHRLLARFLVSGRPGQGAEVKIRNGCHDGYSSERGQTTDSK